MQIGNKYTQDIVLYLDALKKLYSLLVINDDQDNILDEEARFLLKDLLDGAAEKILNTALEVIVSISGQSNKRSSTEQLQPRDLLDQATFLTRTPNTSVDIDKQTDKDLQGQLINKRVADDETVQSVASEQSEASIYVAELQKRKKRCRICRRSNAKQLKFEKGKSSVEKTEDINNEIINLQHKIWHQVDAQEKVLESNSKAILADLSNDREMQERIMGFQFNPSGNGAPDHSSNRDTSGIVTSGALQNFATGTEKIRKDIDCISKDASDAIKTIESRISALKVGSKHVSSCAKQTEPQQGGVFNFDAGSVSGKGTSSLIIGEKAGLVSQGDQTQLGHFVLGRNDSISLLVRRRARETKGLARWRQLSRYVMNPMNELKLQNQTARNSSALSPCNFEPSKSLCENIGKDNETNLRGNTISQVEKLIEGHNLGLQKASPVHVQNVKTNLKKVESMIRSTNSPIQTNSVQGLRTQNSHKKDRKNSMLDKLPVKTTKLILDGNQVDQENKVRRVGKTKPSVSAAELIETHKADRKLLAVRVGNKRIQSRSKTAATSKGLPHQTTMRRTLPSNKRNHSLVSPVMYRERDQLEKGRGKVKKKINQMDQQKMSLSYQKDSVGTTSNGSSSSSWTTQKSSTNYYDSEEYSMTDQSQINQHSATISSSESGGGYVSSSTRGRNSGYTSYSRSESSSVPSSNQSLEDCNSSGEKVGYLPSDQTSSFHSSEPSYRRRRYRSTDRRRPKIQTAGRLQKLKDKLAIIFHHHHHHHHHHYADDSTQSDDRSQAYHGTPLSKHATKIFNKRNQARDYREKAAERLSKSMVRNVPNKKRGANFNKIVGGLVKHVRHSKKSKKSKGGIEHQAKNQHVSKKLAKKVHWWQLLRRRPRRMKMPKKPRLKLGFGIKKSKLQAVPTIKWR